MENNELIIKQNQELVAKADFSDIDVFLQNGMDMLQEKGRHNLLSLFAGSAMAANMAESIANAKRLEVIIPENLKALLEKGEAVFDNSSKNPGQFAPNIRLKGSNEIAGQVTLKPGVNPQMVTQATANLAVFAMMAQIDQKLDEMNKKLDDLFDIGKKNAIEEAKQGFLTFYAAYKAGIVNDIEIKFAANNAVQSMSQGIGKYKNYIAKEIERIQGVNSPFSGAPRNGFTTFIRGFLPGMKDVKYYRKLYNELDRDIVLYYKLNLLLEAVESFRTNSSNAIEVHHLNNVTSFFNKAITPKFQELAAFVVDTKKHPDMKLAINTVFVIDKQYCQSLAEPKYTALAIEAEPRELMLN